jgi:hypothetical protein
MGIHTGLGEALSGSKARHTAADDNSGLHIEFAPTLGPILTAVQAIIRFTR